MRERKKSRARKSAKRSTPLKPVRPKRKPAARSTPAPFLQSRSPLSEIPPEENLSRDLFHESRDALIVTRPDGQIIDVNQTLLDLSGYTREEIHGMSSPDFYDNPADRTRLLREIEEKGFVRDCEITFKRKDGTKRDCLFTVSARRAPDGSVEGHLGIVRDITERKLVQSALRDSEKRYRLLLEAAPDPIVATDREGRIRLVNKQTENVLGYSREELLGQPVELLLPERFRGHHTGHRADYFANPHVRPMGSGLALCAQRKDGSEFPVDISLSPLETGEGTMVVCSLRDITEQEMTRKDLEEQTVFLNSLIENNPLATVVLTPKHHIRMCNLAFENLFQFSQEEILGKDLDDLIVPEELRSEAVEFTASSLAGAAENFYSQRRRKDGTLVEVEVHGVPLLIRGELVGLYVLYQDVTERKKAEEALQASEERFSKAFHASPVSMSITRVEDGHILDINENFLRLSGYTREEVLGRTATDLGFWPSAEDRGKVVDLLKKQGRVKNIEGQFRIKSGELRLYSYSAEKTTIGGEERLLSVVEDITERKRAEEALKNSEERFSKAFHSGPVSMAITRKEDGKVLDVNEDFARGTGYAREKIIGRTGADLEFWRTPEIREEVMQQLEREGRIRNYEEYFYNKLGEKRWYSFSAEQIVIEDEERVLSAVIDITERKKAEAALQLSQFSLDSSSDAAIWVSPQGNILFVSDAACHLTGYSRAELLTMGVWDLNTAVTPDNWPARWQQEKDDGTNRFEAEYRAKDGRVFPVEISTSYLEVDGKEYSFGFVRDITERKRVDRQLAGERQVLEALASGKQLSEILELHTAVLEEQLPGALCSVLLLDEEGRHLLHGAAPSLPTAYNQAIDGMTIGDGQGSCGTAAFKAEQVVVTDVMTDPLWVDFRQLAQEHGLRACWSAPIISGKGKVLGTFAVYHRETHTPIAHEREVVDRAVHLAGVAIEARKAEEALRRSEAGLAKAQRVAHVGSWVYDVVENKVHWSDENYRMFGFVPQSLEASYDVFIQCVHPDDRKSIEQAMRATLEEGVPYSIEHRIVWPDGTVRIVSELAEVVREESGKPLRMIGTVQDITERKKAEEALSQSEKKYGMVLQNVDEIVYVATHTPGNGSVGWSVEFVSPHVQKVLGYSAGDFLQDSKLWVSLLHPDDKEPSMEAMRKLIADKESQIRSYRIQKKDSEEYVWLEDRLVPQIDANGNVVGLFGVARDVTERKNLEERLLQSQKMEAVGQLAGGVAHDFNNLLMVIRGYTDLIGGRGELEGSLQENLAEIRKAADRATSLTQQLLAFSRKQVLHPELISLNDVVANMERMLRRLIGENIELETLVAPELGKIKADPSQIEQVILNLAINARDAMNEGGRLVLETANVELDDAFVRRQPGSRPGPYVLLRVVDTGAGMDAETVSHIFEPFFTTKATGKGTGLGLATVYGIVKQSSAYIVVSSEEGKGTVFEIYLPRVEEETAEPEPERAAIVVGGGSETVLVVEDEGAVCKLSCDYLTSRGYNVLCAGDGLEALQVAERHRGPIHLLLTDVVMPGINGRELARRLNAERPDMKVMYVSGYIDDAVAQAFQKQPGTVFLQKPFPLETLGRQVREILKA